MNRHQSPFTSISAGKFPISGRNSCVIFHFFFSRILEDVGEEMDLYYTNAVTYVMKKIRMALKINFGTAAAQSFTPVDECVIIIYMSRNAHQETGVCA